MDNQGFIKERQIAKEAHTYLRELITDQFEVLFYKHSLNGYNGVLPNVQLSEIEAEGGYGHEGIWVHTMSHFSNDNKRLNPILSSVTLQFKGELEYTEKNSLPIEVLGRPVSYNTLPIEYKVNGQIAGKSYNQINIKTLEALVQVPSGKYNKMIIETLQIAFDKYQSQLSNWRKAQA